MLINSESCSYKKVLCLYRCGGVYYLLFISQTTTIPWYIAHVLQIFIYFKLLMLFFLGAFLVPFFLMLILCAIPLLYMELAVGQYTQNGPVGAIAKLCPLFKGKSLLNSIFLMI